MTQERDALSTNTISGPLAELRQAHVEMMREMRRQRRNSGGEADSAIEDLRAFLNRIRSTGALLPEQAERRDAQDMLDYWSAQLLGFAPATVTAETSPVIEPFRPPEASPDLTAPDPWPTAPEAPETGDAVTPTSDKVSETTAVLEVSGAPSEGLSNDAVAKDEQSRRESREQVRLAALARQWRNSGKKKGYLLSGQALADATHYSRRDPEIEEFARASEDAATRLSQLRYALLGTVIIFLSALCLVLYFTWREAIAARDAEAAEKTDLAAQYNALRHARDKAVVSVEIAQSRLRDLEGKQRQLDAAAAVIRKGLDSGKKIARSDISEELLRAVDAGAAKQAPIFPTNDDALAGYDPRFLGLALPLPRISEAMANQAFEAGRPLHYVNYSLVLSAPRKMAMFTASNLDRQQLRVLPRTKTPFIHDPRAPTGVQLDSSWFAANKFDRGHLVTRQEIAWGSYFGGDAETASRNLGRIVDVYTNVTPQFDTFNQGVWSKLERWVSNEHNATATRVNIFTGPVLSSDDPRVGDVQIPRRFWKIAVSQRFGRSDELMVDAFLVPQFRDGADDKIDRTDFQPALYRVGVRDIEQLTGLDFGDAIRGAQGTVVAPPADLTTESRRAAGEVTRLDAPTAEQRKAAVQKILDLFRDASAPDAEKLIVVDALANMASDTSGSTTGRYNLIYLLSEIPAEIWDRPTWSDGKAKVRRVVADLETGVSLGKIRVGPDTRELLDTLESRLGWSLSSRYTVYLQFAGMTRGDAIAVSDAMKSLGWKIPGEERTSKAAGTNEVRYGDPEDERAANLLAADLRASGLAGVRRVVRVGAIRSGILEIWISQ